jgi:hypothetical protein
MCHEPESIDATGTERRGEMAFTENDAKTFQP